MAARRVRVARDREPADDPVVRLRDEDGGVRVPAHGPQVAALVRRPSASGCPRSASPPAPSRPPRRARPARRRPRAGRAGRMTLAHSTTIPCPPRRGSPAAASEPSCADLDRGDAAEVEVAPAPADDVVAARLEPVELGRVGAALAVDVRLLEVDARRRRSPPRRRSPWSTTLTTACRIAPRRRDRARAADDQPRPPAAERRSRAPSCSSAARPAAPRRRPGSGRTRRACCSGGSRCPGTITPEPEPVEAVSDAAFPRASTTEMCVVPRSPVLGHAGQARPDAPSAARTFCSP